MKDAPPANQIAFIGDYLPRHCGIATFTHDLCEAVAAACPEAQGIGGAGFDPPIFSRRVRSASSRSSAAPSP
jgi:hypothetical protein